MKNQYSKTKGLDKLNTVANLSLGSVMYPNATDEAKALINKYGKQQ